MIRRETAADHDAVGAVLRAAFPTQAEARLVARLRATGDAVVSLVAEQRAPAGTSPAPASIVGHVMFSTVTLTPRDGAGLARGLGLAPLAVLPAAQRRGVGASLVRAGLDACRAHGCGFVVVLGDPAYYGRFGFACAADAGIANEYGAHDEFMVLSLASGSLPPGGGVVRYAAPFAELPA